MEKNLALALYTVRDAFAADSLKTLQTVGDIGYRAVEFAGLGAWKPEDLRAQLEEFGLRGLSAHVPMQRLRDDLPAVIGEAKTLGLEYVVFPWLPPEHRTPEFYRSLVPLLSAVGERCAAEGMTLCYHNHDFELEPVFGAQNALEFFASEISAEHLMFELDVYWAAHAGLDPARWLEQFAGRVPLVHLKDMTKDETRTFAEVGSGRLDFPAILAASERIGAHWSLVEQDQSARGPLESARISFEYLRGLGLGA